MKIIKDSEYKELLNYKQKYVEKTETSNTNYSYPDGYNYKDDFLIIVPYNCRNSQEIMDIFQYVKMPFIYVQGGGLNGKQYLRYKEIDKKEIEKNFKENKNRCNWCGKRYDIKLENCSSCGAPNDKLINE